LELVVDEASDGQRALEMLAHDPFDLLLLDLNMPVLDGYAVAERLRHGGSLLNHDLGIVAYTSEPAQLASVKVRNAGMDGFVSKPSDVLPLAAALCEALERRRRADSFALLAGRRIVLADDNAFNRKAVTAHLRNAGAHVQEVDHGAAVLEQLRTTGGADAVLMDINMPGMSGPEAAQAIRLSSQPWAEVPIIALTAHADGASIQAARIAGMNGYLVKPVDLALLCETLRPLFAPGSVIHPVQGAASHVDVATVPLLNERRLEGYRRVGMLEELLGDYLPAIARLVRELEQATARQDLQATLHALHSLLGMSGEAGATALHHLVRRIYVPMLEQDRWPSAPDWLERIKLLAETTERALKDFGALEQGASAG
jgi:CheY-like chemotaxis protein